MVLPKLPVPLIVGSNIIYHLAQRSAKASSSPWPMLTVTYAFALLFCAALWWADGKAQRVPDRGTLITGLALGVAVLGVELGFYLAYRAGLPLSGASVMSSLGTTTVLALIGVAILGEPMTMMRLGGIVLAGAAGWMMVRG